MRPRRVLGLLLLPLVAGLTGCAAEEARPGPRDEPFAAAPTPPPSPAVPEPEPEGGAVVIKGSKRKNTTPAATRTAAPNPNQAKIDELKRQAKDSEGKNEGGPIAATPAPATTPYDASAAHLNELEAERGQLLSEKDTLQKEKAGLMIETKKRQGNKAVGVEISTDVNRTNAIDARVAEIDKRLGVIEPEIKELRGSAGTGTFAPVQPSQTRIGPQGPGTSGGAPVQGLPPAGTTPQSTGNPPTGTPPTGTDPPR